MDQTEDQAEPFGQRVRRLRHLNVMTQADLAERAGVSPVTVARLETDEGESRPRPTTVRRLAKALGVDPAWLLFGDGAETGKADARVSERRPVVPHPSRSGRRLDERITGGTPG